MKAKLLTIGFSAVIVSLLMCSLVHASWSTLKTGYAVTSNWEGKLTDSPVTITAGTLDSTVTSVTFKWLAITDGSDDYLLDETVPVYTNGTIGYWKNGTAAEIRYAESTYVIDQRFWMVQILFSNSEGESNMFLSNSEGENNDNVVKQFYWVDATNYDYNPVFHVPEIALGTIGASVAVAAALGLFMIKKKRQQK
jgi:hypothetical protein